MFSKRLMQLVPEARRFVVCSAALKWASLLALMALFASLGQFMESLAKGSADDAALLQVILIASLCIAVRFACDAGARYAGSRAAAVGKAKARQVVFEKLVRLGPAYRERVSSSHAAQIMGEGIQKLDGYFGSYLPQLFFAVLAPLTLFVFCCTLSPLTAIVLLACVPLVPACIMVFMRVAKRAMGAYWNSYVDLGKEFFESIRAMTMLVVFRADERQACQMREQAERFRLATMKLLRVQLHSVTIMDMLAYGSAAAGMVVVLFQCAQGALSLGSALVLVLLALEFFMPMRELGSCFHTAMGAATVIDQVFEVLDAPEADEGLTPVDPAIVDVTFESVSYSFADGRRALAEVDFSVEPGSFVGITGESGAGKSTLAGILCGTLRGYEGSVRIGGVEVRQSAPESLHETVTCVAACATVFKGTFRTNLLMGNAQASDYQMWNVLARCRIDDFVLRLGGLDAPIAEAGSNLSGGQRQRLCVARAVLRDTPVYVFDEATSNIDAESERDILTFVQELAFEKTVILISHRLSALAWADDILVLDAGRVVQRGSHGELLSQQGCYARLWGQQERLESFARGAREVMASSQPVDGEASLDVPEAMADALNQMPTKVAVAALQVMKGARIRALTQGGDAVPAGHPAGVPLDGDGALPRAACAVGGEDGTPSDTVVASRSSFGVLTGLLGLSRSLAPMLVRSAVCGVLGYAAALGMVGLTACALAGLAGYPFSIALPIVAVLVLLCGAVRGFLRYGERLATHDETFRTLALIRNRIVEHMRAAAPARLEQRDKGDLAALLTSDVELLEAFYARTLSPVLIAFVFSVLVVAGVAVFSVPLAAVLLACFLVTGVIVPFVTSRIVGKGASDVRARAVGLNSFIIESLEGLPELLQCGCAHLRLDELGGRMGAFAGRERTLVRRAAIAGAACDGLALAGGLVVALVAAWFAMQGQLGYGVAVLCAAGARALFDPVASAAQRGTSLHQTIAAARRVLAFLDERPQTPVVEKGRDVRVFSGARLCDVGFSYGSKSVLRGVNLDVSEGSVIHIAGKSGSGKSTMVKLLMRFWDAQTGVVEVSRTNVSQVNTASLRSIEGYMTQETHLLEGTLRENLLIVRPQATDEELHAAIAKASLAQFVERLPLGLDTPVERAGARLSDGERQRVGLARLFLYDAPLMVLDEPTSNLDCLNEAAILESLAKESEGKTVMIVSHRSTAAAIADVTCTMNSGCLS